MKLDLTDKQVVRIPYYPRRVYFKMIVATRWLQGVTRNAVIQQAVKEHFDKMSEEERQRLIDIFDSIPDDKIKRKYVKKKTKE